MYSWVHFYLELSRKLTAYHSNKAELLNKLGRVFQNTTEPKALSMTKRYGMDPFTAVALFNDNKKASSKTSLCIKYKQVFKMKSSVPGDFAGIPVMHFSNVAFREADGQRSQSKIEEDIEALWNLFLQIDVKDEDQFADAFDRALKVRTVAAVKMSMGLFYFRPDYFVPLDRYTKVYLYSQGFNCYEDTIDGRRYLQICKDVKNLCNKNGMKLYDLSAKAYQYGKKLQKQTSDLKEKTVKTQPSDYINDLGEENEVSLQLAGELTNNDGLVNEPYISIINKDEGNNRKDYSRENKNSCKALALANYTCELEKKNEKHKTFKRRTDGTNYMEAHHLVPMFASEEFNMILDNPINIVCLCSNCHNNIHYGINSDDLVLELFRKRKKKLNDFGIKITQKRLLELYHCGRRDANSDQKAD